MAEWKLEVAAESLRRGDPVSWDQFMLALEQERQDVIQRWHDAPPGEVVPLQGAARAYRALLERLRDAPKTVERLQQK